MPFRLLAAHNENLPVVVAVVAAVAGSVLASICRLLWIRSRKIPNRIVKRREELLEEIKAVFPDPTSHSREALTDKIDVIVTHDVWFELLQTFSREIVNSIFVSVFVILLLGLFRFRISQMLPLITAMPLVLFPWIFWVALLVWAESWGNSRNTTTVLGLVIPSGVLILPKALIYIGV